MTDGHANWPASNGRGKSRPVRLFPGSYNGFIFLSGTSPVS
jgi:hypothetical protein